MNACIYARTSGADESHNRTGIERQVEDARAVAHSQNLRVAYKHVYTDIDYDGHLPPTQWTHGDDETRPALSAMISAIEQGSIERVIVRQAERLGTTSETLMAILELCREYGVRIVPTRESISYQDEPNEAFATSILKPVMIFDSAEEQVRKARKRQTKIEELERLRAKVARLETEIAELA
jgi:DNA invertase Pin-like site-specific DNA recombinase